MLAIGQHYDYGAPVWGSYLCSDASGEISQVFEIAKKLIRP